MKSTVDAFVAKMRVLTERQARNVRWAIINKGPYRLHPSLRHLQLSEEAWIVMSKEDKDAYVEMVLQSDVYLELVADQLQSNVHEVKTSGSDDVESSDATGEEATYGLSVLAEAALNVLDDYEGPEILVHSNEELSMITLREFSEYLNNQPSETIRGIYAKSLELLQKPNAIVPAPGCDVKARMVESRRLKERPRQVKGQENISARRTALITMVFAYVRTQL